MLSRIRRRIGRRLERFSPPALLAVLYLFVILCGTTLLAMPVSQQRPLDLFEAFFTATSSVTVTGLGVVDTGTSFTLFGQAVIAALMQAGGMGLMAFAAMVLISLGIRIGVPQRALLGEELRTTSLSSLGRVARTILTFGLAAEAVGALLLSAVFVPDLGLGMGVWHSVFHSISAFNNAGVQLWPDGLMRYADDPIVTVTVPALFILGGIGFVVVGEVWKKRRWAALTIHSKLMLVGTAVLLVAGWIAVGLLEWSNPATLGALDGPGGRLQAAFFLSATTRTAGFNTVDIAGLHDATTILVMLFMFIGAGPASTAGGIKVTTAIVLFLATIAFFKRRETLHVFGRSLGLEEVMKVMALITVSGVMIVVSIFVLAIRWEGHILDLSFEVVSAFATVGLTRGATTELDGVSQLILCFMMFMGRVGPLTLGFFLATRSTPRVRYPKGQVYLG